MSLVPYGKNANTVTLKMIIINKNNFSYESFKIPEIRIYFTSLPTTDNPKNVQCRRCTCDRFSPEKKDYRFWK